MTASVTIERVRRSGLGRASAAAVGLYCLAVWACDETGGGPFDPPDPFGSTFEAVVSNPIAPQGGSALAEPRFASLSGTAFVSLAPGTVSSGARIRIENRAAGFSLELPSFVGGLDPVAVPANVGDTLLLTVLGAGAADSAQAVVQAAREPRVVRTEPARGKRDVPLNAPVIIVFSEPIDAQSLASAHIRLRRGETLVAGSLEFRDPQQLMVGFVPDEPLDGGTEYRLEIEETVRDLDGDALDSAMVVGFTTGSAAAVQPRIRIFPDTIRTVPLPWELGWIRAVVRDVDGSEILETPVVWNSGDPSVVTVRSLDGRTCPGCDDHQHGRDAQLSGSGVPGSTILTASSAGYVDTAVVIVDWLDPVSAIGVGVNRVACYLGTEGRLFCRSGSGASADSRFREVGLGAAVINFPYPVQISGSLDVASFSVGYSYVCALTTSDRTYCWGQNGRGQLGSAPAGTDLAAPTPIAGNVTMTQVDGGFMHTCAIGTDARAYCWGENRSGELGNGFTSDSHEPVAVDGGSMRFIQISAGGGHTCGIADNGVSYCWGRNTSGQLGVDDFDDRSLPSEVRGGYEFVHISAGYGFTCGLTASGEAYCWGAYDQQFGSSVPLRVDLPTGVRLTQLDASIYVVCGVATDGTAYCWGYDIATYGDPNVPPTAIEGAAFRSVSAGDSNGSCGLTADSVVYCWNTFGDRTAYKMEGQR